MKSAFKEVWTFVACFCLAVSLACAIGAALLPQVAGIFIAAGVGIVLSQVILATTLPIFYGWHRK